jgi:hypothetical protein
VGVIVGVTDGVLVIVGVIVGVTVGVAVFVGVGVGQTTPNLSILHVSQSLNSFMDIKL